MGQIRTFIAIDVSNAIRNAASKMISKLSVHAVDYNWLEKENIHITLNFLGNVNEAEVPEVCKLVHKTASGFGAFDLSLSGLGCFPKPEKPRIVWMGINDGRDELIELNGKLADALEAMRFPKDRHDYRPHLTLGRIQRGGRFSPALSEAVSQSANQRFGDMAVDEVIVYSSYLDRRGPTYTPMYRIAL